MTHLSEKSLARIGEYRKQLEERIAEHNRKCSCGKCQSDNATARKVADVVITSLLDTMEDKCVYDTCSETLVVLGHAIDAVTMILIEPFMHETLFNKGISRQQQNNACWEIGRMRGYFHSEADRLGQLLEKAYGPQESGQDAAFEQIEELLRKMGFTQIRLDGNGGLPKQPKT